MERCQIQGCPNQPRTEDWPCRGCAEALGRFYVIKEGPNLERPENRGDDMKSPTVPEVMG